LTHPFFKNEKTPFDFLPVFPSLCTPFHWQNAEMEKTEKEEKRCSSQQPENFKSTKLFPQVFLLGKVIFLDIIL